MRGERLLLIRRGGILWGVAQARVRSVSRPEEPGGAFRLRVADLELAADEIVGVADGVPIYPAAVVASFWSEAAGGLAVHGGTPFVVVDPERPPACLRSG